MIYFIECAGRVKIGFSLDPWKRLGKVSADAPFPCELLGVVEGDRKIEDEVQSTWQHLRCHGEWFAASKELLSWVSENAHGGFSNKRRRLPKSGDERKPHNKMCGLHVARGAKSKIARACGVTPGAVAQWQKVPAEYCGIVSDITGHHVSVLRPDIFGDWMLEDAA